MKFIIEECEGYPEPEITIKCSELSQEILDLLREFRLQNQKLTGLQTDHTYLLDYTEIFYFESVDDKVFAYTLKDVYEISFKLYELEEKLPSKYFFRASKASIINFSHIISLKSLLNGKLQVTLRNNENLIVSRHHVPLLKEKLGVSKR